MHVLVILKYIPARDSELKSDCLWTIIDGLSAEGVQITLATKGKSAPHEFPQVYHKALSRFLEDPQQEVNPFPAGFPDVSLAVCTSEYPAVFAHRLFRVLGIPFVVQEHRTLYDRQYLISEDVPEALQHALKDAGGVYAVSSPLARTMQLRGIHRDIGVLPNSLPHRFFQKPTALEGKGRIPDFLAWSADHFVFGAWTNWRSFKRVDLLLEAFRQFHAQTGSGRLTIAGPLRDPWNEERVREFLETHGLQTCVYLFGTADRAEIHAIAHRIDCCVVPSDFETFGLPALEAQAAGKPVIATRCGGPEDIVSDTTSGLLVARKNLQELVNALSLVHRNREEYDPVAISQNAFRKFSRKVVAIKFIEALRLVKEGSAVRFEEEVARFILLQRTNILPESEKRKTKQLSTDKQRRLSRNDVVADYASRDHKTVISRYLKTMEKDFLALRPFLPQTARTILDVGCGIAGLDLFLFRHFGADGARLFLLDKTETSDAIWYGYEKKGAFYNSLSMARSFLLARDVDPEKITLIEAPEDGILPQDLPPLDLVVSTLSWGFHYPVAAYLDSVYDRLSENGHLILDVRKDTDGESLLQDKFGKVNVVRIRDKEKYFTLSCTKGPPVAGKMIRVSGNCFSIPGPAKDSTGARLRISEQWMPDLIAALQGADTEPTLLDVGINIGQTLLSFKARFPAGIYVGFEPIPASVHFVQSLVKENRLENCAIVPVALADHAGISKIYVTNGNPTGSGSTMKRGVKSLSKKIVEFAATYRLDDIFLNLDVKTVDTLKVDVEGMEAEVIRGAKGVIRRFRPSIIIEILPEGKENRVFEEVRREIAGFCKKERYHLYAVAKAENGGFVGLRCMAEDGQDPETAWADRDFVLLPVESPRRLELCSPEDALTANDR